jgi:hypothetical protein
MTEETLPTNVRIRRRRRKTNEQTIKDSVMIIGSLMMLFSFGMMAEINFRDNGWSESDEKKITIISSCAAFLLFAILFGIYLFFRLRKICKKQEITEPAEPQSVSLFLFFA